LIAFKYSVLLRAEAEHILPVGSLRLYEVIMFLNIIFVVN